MVPSLSQVKSPNVVSFPGIASCDSSELAGEARCLGDGGRSRGAEGDGEGESCQSAA